MYLVVVQPIIKISTMNHFVRFALCHDCSRSESQSIKGIVTRIDYDNKMIHLTNEFNLSNYPKQIARYHIAVIIFLSTIIYLLIGMEGLLCTTKLIKRTNQKIKGGLVSHDSNAVIYN